MRRAVPVAAALAAALAGQMQTYRSSVRLVEVYATVFDERGRHVDGLSREQFRVSEDGKPQEIVTFETETASLSCAIALDVTGSMAAALPTLKSSVCTLIDELGPSDSVAIYGFSNAVALLQDFTADKRMAKQAVLRTRAAGNTALYDAVAEISRDIALRNGKKAILVFTDGNDNASALHLDAAVGRARRAGVPVYTIAQGDALGNRRLMEQLRSISQLSGAAAFEVRKADRIPRVFGEISQDLRHTYMLAYRPHGDPDHKWRAIQVSVTGHSQYRIRAKQGYFAE